MGVLPVSFIRMLGCTGWFMLTMVITWVCWEVHALAVVAQYSLICLYSVFASVWETSSVATEKNQPPTLNLL